MLILFQISILFCPVLSVKLLTAAKGYDAEATISPDGKKIIFTSMRDGDLDLYSMDKNGKNVKR
ncbi:MAG TPA: hypothetical protein VNI60_03125, partial [Pyrinomonadaceae bacterium]|nr:hypothetical protein [Pyrinomonadaceae bacterium]